MEWQVILVLIVAIPVILFPAAFVWYMNFGGIYAAIKQRRKRRAEAARGAGTEKLWGEAPQSQEKSHR